MDNFDLSILRESQVDASMSIESLADRVALSRKRVDTWQRFGFPAEFKTAEQTADILGTDFWYGGMYNRSGGHINPLALARSMAQAAEKLGAVICET